MQFSRRTLSALARALEVLSHAELSELFYRFDAASDPGDDRNKLTRSLALVHALELELVVGVPDAIAREILLEVWPRIQWDHTPLANRLSAALALDGYELTADGLRPASPTQGSPASGFSLVELSLEHAGLTVVLAHYRQSIATFVEQQHEAANGQLRSAVEAFFRELPRFVGGVPTSDAVAGLQELQRRKSIDVQELHFLKSFWGILQDEGPHSGLTTAHESELRLQFGTSVIRYLLEKLALTRATGG